MANDVRIQFSAQIGELISGVDQVKRAISSVGDSVDGVGQSLTHLGEIFGVALSVAGIKAFIDSMAELGERTTSMEATLGITSEEVGKLDAVAKGAGTSTEVLARGVETFQLNLQKAQAGTGAAAQALQALGLNAKDFIGLSIDQQINKFSDAIARFADGGNKAAAVRALWGRMGDDLIPLFDQGAAGFAQFTAMAERAGTILSGTTAAAFEQTHSKLVELGLAIEGFGIRLFEGLKPVIDRATDSITKFVEGLESQKIETSLKNIGTVVVNVLEQISILFVTVESKFDELAAHMQGGGDPHPIARGFFNIMEPGLGDWVAGKDSLPGKLKEVEDAARVRIEAITKMAADYRASIASFSIPPGGSASAPGAAGSNKPPVPAFDVPNKDALNAQMEQYQSQIKLADEAYKSTQEKLSSEVKLHEITYDQETQALLAALNKRRDAEEAAIDGELSLYARGTAGYEKALAERRLMEAKYFAERQKTQDQQLQQDAKAWQSALEPIKGAFNSQLQGLLSGTESWGQAMKKIFGDLVIKAIEGAEEIAIRWASTELAKTTATVTGVAVRTGAEEAGAATALGSKVAEATATIGIDIGQIFANLAAWLTSTFGPAGIPIALGLAGGVGALALSKMHGYETGAWEIPSTSPALLHAGEMVIPSGPAEAFRSVMAGGGGGANAAGGLQVHFNGNVMGTQQWTNSMIQQLARALTQYQARTPSSNFG